MALLLAGCGTRGRAAKPDRPRLTPNVAMRDVTFYSAALRRDMQYRVVLPKALVSGEKLPVLYLLHGRGEGFRDWSNDSDVARFAERRMILVMPEGRGSYYTNSAAHPQDRYEDYIVDDLVRDVESKFPAARDRAQRAIAGVSMGGFGAVKLALKHPRLFGFAAGLSPALDVPSRPFSIQRALTWREHRAIFGPWDSAWSRANDPYVLARSADPAETPFLYLSCGDQEGLLPANRKFAALLAARGFQYEFHAAAGGHNWNQWNRELPHMFESLLQHMGR